MRAVVTRVTRARVEIAGRIVASIDRDLLVLLGVAAADTVADAIALANKIYELRIFADGAGAMNRSLADTGGALLVVSQFTLLGDVRKGRRPSFVAAARPELGRERYEAFVNAARTLVARVETGEFGADMAVASVNDGPVTILIDTTKLEVLYFVTQSTPHMEVRQALADIAEVRGRLATVQRFDGYSGPAAIASGVVAIAAGVAQAIVAPEPQTAAERQTYLTIWLACLGCALLINYGAILAWRTRNRGAQAKVQIRTVGMSIVPALAAGGVISLALVIRGLTDLLPGMWCATYALGLFASRAMVPRDVVIVAVAFGAAATVLLLAPHIHPLAWWIMPSAFGIGQIAIGAIVRFDRSAFERIAHP